jgi:hypothetical protein
MILNSARGPGSLRVSGHRWGFHALVLTIGFIAGGAMQTVARQFLPPGPAKEFLTAGLSPYFPPLPINLILLKFTVGPVAMDVSLLSLLGVIIAYLIARSLF